MSRQPRGAVGSGNITDNGANTYTWVKRYDGFVSGDLLGFPKLSQPRLGVTRSCIVHTWPLRAAYGSAEGVMKA